MLIAHATTHLANDDVGFVVGAALAAAHEGACELVTVHLAVDTPALSVPRIEPWLSRWGLPTGRIEHSLFSTSARTGPVEGLLEACRELQPELLILPTSVRRSLSRQLADTVAWRLPVPSLLLPYHARRLVDENTGKLHLTRIVVLGGSEADAQLGVDSAVWFADKFAGANAVVTLVHAHAHWPSPMIKHAADVELRVLHRSGEPTDVCTELQPQLVVMVSHHRQANRAEPVLRSVNRPLLCVPPAGSVFSMKS